MPRLLLLDFVRFVLAMLVATMHVEGFFKPYKAYLAVDFFFILSGFVLCGAYAPGCTREGFFGRFAIDRIARLYPLHLATLLLLVAMNALFWWSTGTHLEAGWAYKDGLAYTFVLNLLLLHNVGLTTNSSWNSPSWSISVEFVLNLVLALLLPALVARRIAWPWLVALAIGCYALLFGNGANLAEFSANLKGFASTGLLRGVAGISLGVVAWIAYERLRVEPAPRRHGLYAAASLAAFMAVMVFGSSVRNADLVAVPFMFCAVLFVALHETARPLPPGALARVLLALGGASYAVYLVHWPIVTFVRYQMIYAWKLPIDLEAPLTTIAVLALVVAVALPVHFRFELPMKRILKRRLRGAPVHAQG